MTDGKERIKGRGSILQNYWVDRTIVKQTNKMKDKKDSKKVNKKEK